MSFAAVLAQHTTTGKTLIRNIERTSKKITNTEAAVLFNNKCIYTSVYITIHICLVKKTQRGYLTYRYRSREICVNTLRYICIP